jgi:hypothetical protein
MVLRAIADDGVAVSALVSDNHSMRTIRYALDDHRMVWVPRTERHITTPGANLFRHLGLKLDGYLIQVNRTIVRLCDMSRGYPHV